MSYWRGRRLDYPQYRDVPLMIDEQDEAEEASIKLKALESFSITLIRDKIRSKVFLDTVTAFDFSLSYHAWQEFRHRIALNIWRPVIIESKIDRES